MCVKGIKTHTDNSLCHANSVRRWWITEESQACVWNSLWPSFPLNSGSFPATVLTSRGEAKYIVSRTTLSTVIYKAMNSISSVCPVIFNSNLQYGSQIATLSPTLKSLKLIVKRRLLRKHLSIMENTWNPFLELQTISVLLSSTVESYRKCFLPAAITLNNEPSLYQTWASRFSSSNQGSVIHLYI